MNKNEYALIHKMEQEYWWYKGLHDLVEKIIKKHLSGRNATRILDAGCGTGGMLHIAGRYGQAEGFDFSEEAIYFCKKNKIADVFQQDLNSWEPPTTHYDSIICLDVLYHSAIKDDEEIIGKFYQALKANGICLINLPAFPILSRNHDLAVHTKKRYRRSEVVSLLKNAGFQIKMDSYRLPHLFLLILVKKFFQRIFSGNKSQSDLQEIPGWINYILYHLHRLENKIIISGLPMPFGSSVFVMAQKTELISP